MSRLRLIRPVDAVSINSGGSNFWQITVPNLVGVFRERDSLEFTFASLVEQAQFDFGRVGREAGEVCTLAVPRCAARMRQTLLNHAFSRFPHRIIFSFRFLRGFKIRSFLIEAPAPYGIEVTTKICTRRLSSFLDPLRAQELKSHLSRNAIGSQERLCGGGGCQGRPAVRRTFVLTVPTVAQEMSPPV